MLFEEMNPVKPLQTLFWFDKNGEYESSAWNRSIPREFRRHPKRMVSRASIPGKSSRPLDALSHAYLSKSSPKG
jgi:hypothetical protein